MKHHQKCITVHQERNLAYILKKLISSKPKYCSSGVPVFPNNHKHRRFTEN